MGNHVNDGHCSDGHGGICIGNTYSGDDDSDFNVPLYNIKVMMTRIMWLNNVAQTQSQIFDLMVLHVEKELFAWIEDTLLALIHTSYHKTKFQLQINNLKAPQMFESMKVPE